MSKANLINNLTRLGLVGTLVENGDYWEYYITDYSKRKDLDKKSRLIVANNILQRVAKNNVSIFLIPDGVKEIEATAITHEIAEVKGIGKVELVPSYRFVAREGDKLTLSYYRVNKYGEPVLPQIISVARNTTAKQEAKLAKALYQQDKAISADGIKEYIKKTIGRPVPRNKTIERWLAEPNGAYHYVQRYIDTKGKYT